MITTFSSPTTSKAIGIFGLAAIVALMLGLSSASAAPPQGPWIEPPVTLSGTETAYEPSVAFSPDGSATAVLVDIRRNGRDGHGSRGGQASRRKLSHPGPHFCGLCRGRTRRITIGADGTRGRTWATFVDGKVIIEATTRPPGGSFATPVGISSATSASNLEPRVGVAPDGKATFVWKGAATLGSDYSIETSTGTSASGFSPAASLSGSGTDNYDPQIAVGADGTTSAVWNTFDPVTTKNRIQSATRPSGGAFAPAVDVSPEGEDSEDAGVVVDSSGKTTWSVWRYDGGVVEVKESTKPAGGSFSEAATLSKPGLNAIDPDIAVGRDDTTVVAWTGSNEIVGNTVAQASTRPPNGTFSAPVELTTQDPVGSYNAEASVGPDGTTTVVWGQSWGGNALRHRDPAGRRRFR